MGCYNSTVIAAPVESVWAAIRDFHDLTWATGVVNSTEKVGATAGTTPGARRVLNALFHETLLTVDEANHTFTYSIDDGPGPVAKDAVKGYVGEVRLLPVTDGDRTFIEWSSRWESGSGEVSEFCNPIYRALLNALKKHFA